MAGIPIATELGVSPNEAERIVTKAVAKMPALQNVVARIAAMVTATVFVAST